MTRATEDGNLKWRWPHISRPTTYSVLLAYLVANGVVALIAEPDELIGTLFGGAVLIWCCYGYLVVRSNSRFFRIRRSKH